MEELVMTGDGTSHYLALMRDAGVETVVEPIALEVDIVRHTIIEGIIGEVIAVQFSRQIGVMHVVDLGDPRERGLGSGVDFPTRC
jgi:hypothetical protein